MFRFAFYLAVVSASLMVGTVAANAGQYKTIPIQEGGMKSAYVTVPANVRCPVQIADVPTAFCAGAGNRIYHMKSVNLQNPVDPRQYLQSVINDPANKDAEILEQYPLPDLTSHIIRRDAPLLFRRGQQITTYAFEARNKMKKEKAVMVLSIANIPNNGAPVAQITVYGISDDLSSPDTLAQIRAELLQFIKSYRYDERAIQVINARSVGFQQDLRAREQAFYNKQRAIHQSNMDALDSSHKRFMDNSRASDRSQRQYVDSIHERRQMVNPETGQGYEVDGYGDNVYVNPNDPSVYYRTDDPNYDPNVNSNIGEDYDQLEDSRW